MKKPLLIILFIAYIFMGCSYIKKNEKYYQTIFCENVDGIIEYRLKDKTRIDCLTNEYAIEVDWAKKWAAAIGQSLYYSHMTKRKAGIALISSSEDKRFLSRVNQISKKFDIKVFVIEK